MKGKKVLLAIPQRLLEQTDLLAKHRSQTRSELIREALRTHVDACHALVAARPPIALVRNQEEVGLAK